MWRDIISALRLVGYDWVVSVEHEDVLMGTDEGVRKALDLLLRLCPNEPAARSWEW